MEENTLFWTEEGFVPALLSREDVERTVRRIRRSKQAPVVKICVRGPTRGFVVSVALPQPTLGMDIQYGERSFTAFDMLMRVRACFENPEGA